MIVRFRYIFQLDREKFEMSKYNALWEFVRTADSPQLVLTYDEIQEIAGVAIDHSFLNYKKELIQYGYEVSKISMKNKSVIFTKTK